MKSLILLLSIFFTNISFAAIPTIEGLLRHGSNVDIATDTVAVRLKFEKKTESPLNFTAIKEDMTSTIVEGEVENKETPIYIKLIFSLIENRPVSMLQIIYKDSQMGEDSILSVKLIKDLKREISKDQNVERNLFYSIVSMYSLNDSELISKLLESTSQDYKNNIDMLDPDKKALLARYKDYLAAIKENETLKETMVSPLKSEDEEEKEKIKEIMKRKMYTTSENVKLIRDKGKFFWQVKLENFEGTFSNVKNQLLKMELNTSNGSIKSTISDYVLFDGTHENNIRRMRKK